MNTIKFSSCVMKAFKFSLYFALMKILKFSLHLMKIFMVFTTKILCIFFLCLHKNICHGYSLEVPWQGASNEYPQHMFSWRHRKNVRTFQLTKSALSGAVSTSKLHSLMACQNQNLLLVTHE